MICDHVMILVMSRVHTIVHTQQAYRGGGESRVFRRFFAFKKKAISRIKIKMAPGERKMNFTSDRV